MDELEFGLSVPARHPALAGHFPGGAVVPGVLLLDQLMRSLQRATARRVTGLRQVRFTARLYPEEQATVRCSVDGSRVSFRVRVLRGGSTTEIASGLLALDEPCRHAA